jgi:hypothetical protein
MTSGLMVAVEYRCMRSDEIAPFKSKLAQSFCFSSIVE